MNSLAIVVGDFNPEKYISDKLVASMSKIDSLIVHSIFDLLLLFAIRNSFYPLYKTK